MARTFRSAQPAATCASIVTDPRGEQRGTRPIPAGQSVTDSVITGPNIQIGAAGDVTITLNRPDYLLELLVPSFPPPPPPRWRQTPGHLLDAQRQVVPFWPRSDDLDALGAWRDDAQAGVSVHLIYGPGGQGKTRLASRFATDSHAIGWRVEQGVDKLLGRQSPPGRLEARSGRADQPRLIVVDYGERWRLPVLVQLLKDLEVERPDRRVRVLLLARPGPVLWDDLRSALGRSTVDVRDPRGLSPLTGPDEFRTRAFEQAVEAFAGALGLPGIRLDPPRDLDRIEYGTPLTLHMAALAGVYAHRDEEAPPERAEELSSYLLDHERRGWQQTAASLAATAQYGPVAANAVERAVLVATLLGPLPPAAARVALRRAHVAATDTEAEQILAVHQLLYPTATSDLDQPRIPEGERPRTRDPVMLEPLRPDRLGEDFLAHTISRGWGRALVAALVKSWDADEASTEVEAVLPTRRALTVLAAAGSRHDEVARCLFDLLDTEPRLVHHASGEVIRLVTEKAPPKSLERVDAALPLFNIDLLRPARDLALRLLDELPTDAHPAQRAHRLARVGLRLADAGDKRAAIGASREAVRLYQRLAVGDPGTYLRGLAGALNNLGNQLAEVGERRMGLDASRAAVGLYRQLAAADPARHLRDLAGTLTNLGTQLAKVGERGAGLDASREAVGLYRRLVAVDPARHLRDLAAALTNLGTQLAKVGDAEPALNACREAVGLYRRLAKENPAAYLPDLASALTNLSNRLGEVGEGQAGLDACREAVEIRRRLAAAEPAAYLPDLASAFGTLGNRLSDVGEREAGLDATRAAVGLYQRLAEADPVAYLPDLATALKSLSVELAATGDKQAALDAGDAAVGLYRRLAERDPAAYLPDLASATANLALRLLEVGDRRALDVGRDAVGLYRRLAGGDPAAYLPDLAVALGSFTTVRIVARLDLPEALSDTKEAIEIFRKLAAESPAAFRRHLHATEGLLDVIRDLLQHGDDQSP
jgi:Tetratricopeptide repeat